MRKSFLVFLSFILFYSPVLQAQDGFVPAGGNDAGLGGKISFSTGLIIQATMQGAANLLVNEGLQQPLVPAGEIEVKWNNQPITNGSTVPSVTNGTDFEVGYISSDTSLHPVSTFVIFNNSQNTLSIANMQFSGVDSVDFEWSSSANLPVDVMGGDSITITLKFKPQSAFSGVGDTTPVDTLREATFTIQSNDADDGSFSFALSGWAAGEATVDLKLVTAGATHTRLHGQLAGDSLALYSPISGGNVRNYLLDGSGEDFGIGDHTGYGSGDITIQPLGVLPNQYWYFFYDDNTVAGYPIRNTTGYAGAGTTLVTGKGNVPVQINNIGLDGSHTDYLFYVDIPLELDTNYATTFTYFDITGEYYADTILFETRGVLEDRDLQSLNGGDGNYIGTSLSIARTGGAQAEDYFYVKNGTFFEIRNDSLFTGSNFIGLADNSSNQLHINFSGGSGVIISSQMVNDILHAVIYSNSNGSLSTAISFDVTFNDGREDQTTTKTIRPSTEDIYYVDYAASGMDDGTTWSDAFVDLQDALRVANAGDQIWIAQGTYYPTSTADRSATYLIPSGVHVYGSLPSGATLVTQQDLATYPTILSGDIGTTGDSLDNVYSVLTINHVSDTILLKGIVVTGGQSDNASLFLESRGGGLLHIPSPDSKGILIIDSCEFYYNVAGIDGGATYSTGNLEIRNSSFHHNLSLGDGGAIYSIGSVNITRSTFATNDANDDGGAIYSSTGKFSTFTTTYAHNEALDVGGAICFQIPESGFSDTLFFEDIVFLENTTENEGSCIFLNSIANPTAPVVRVIRNSVRGNQNLSTADGFGSFYFDVDGGASQIEVIIESTEFIGNYAGEDGAAIAVDDDIVTSMYHCTFVGNSAEDDGVIANGTDVASTFNFYNCIDYNNDADDFSDGIIDTDGDVNIFNCYFEEHENRISTNSSTVQSTNLYDSTDFKDILLVDYTFNPSQAPFSAGDYRLQETSPLINLGDSTYAVNVLKDLAGNPRFRGNRPDLGAFELPPPGKIVVRGNNQTITNGRTTTLVSDGTDLQVGYISTDSSLHAVQQFVIYNDTAFNLTLSSISISGVDSADFEVVFDTIPLVISGGDSSIVTVAFRPRSAYTAVGDTTPVDTLREVTLEILSNDVADDTFSIALSGWAAGEATVDLKLVTAGATHTRLHGQLAGDSLALYTPISGGNVRNYQLDGSGEDFGLGDHTGYGSGDITIQPLGVLPNQYWYFFYDDNTVAGYPIRNTTGYAGAGTTLITGKGNVPVQIDNIGLDGSHTDYLFYVDIPLELDTNYATTFTYFDITGEYYADTIRLESRGLISDPDLQAFNGNAGNYEGTSLTIVRSGGANTNDAFSLKNGLYYLVRNDSIFTGSNYIGTFDNTGNQIQVYFEGSNSVIVSSQMVNDILHGITYTNGNGMLSSSLTFEVTFNDGAEDQKTTKTIRPNTKDIYYVDSAATGTTDGSSWSDAFTDLQDALFVAHAGDQIWVSQGTYFPTDTADRRVSFEIPSGVKIYGSLMAGATSISQQDFENHPTVLSGDIGIAGDSLDNSYTVVLISQAEDSIVLSGLTIMGGQSTVVQTIDQARGGGITHVPAAEATSILFILNCQIINNVASIEGGGIYSSGWLDIRNSSFRNNHSLTDGGSIFSTGKFTCSSSTFEKNRAGDVGAGICFQIQETGFSDTLTIADVIFRENTTQSEGSCVYFNSIADPVAPVVQIMRNSIRGNQNLSTTSGKGSLFFDVDNGAGQVSVFIESTEFIGNYAGEDGAALEVVDNIDVTFRNCTFVGNYAGDDGCVADSEDNTSSLTFYNCLEFDNDADDTGDGIIDAAGDYFIYHSYFERGSDRLSAEGTSEFNNSFDMTDFAEVYLVDYTADPSQAPFIEGNYRLGKESPLINLGDSAYAATVALDINGKARIQDGFPDLGAYELPPLFAGGIGTAGNPYQISNWDHLFNVRFRLDSNFVLVNELNRDTSWYETLASDTANGGAGWEPVGTELAPFGGALSGQGYTIKDFVVNQTTGLGGLFGKVVGGSFQNLHLLDFNVTGTNAGALAGETQNATVDTLSAIGVVTASGSDPYPGKQGFAGGLVGLDSNSVFQLSFAASAVTGYAAGGLIGGLERTQIRNCYAVDSTVSGVVVGGLAGGALADVTIENVFASNGVVMETGTGQAAGGLLAKKYDSGATLTVLNAFWDETFSNQANSAGGTAKTTSQLTDVQTYTVDTVTGLTTAWDFVGMVNNDGASNDYWDMDQAETINRGLPIFTWQNGADTILTLIPEVSLRNALGAYWSFSENYKADFGGSSFDLEAPSMPPVLKDTSYISGGAVRLHRDSAHYLKTSTMINPEDDDFTYMVRYQPLTTVSGAAVYKLMESLPWLQGSDIAAISYGLQSDGTDGFGVVRLDAQNGGTGSTGSDDKFDFKNATGTGSFGAGANTWYTLLVTYKASSRELTGNLWGSDGTQRTHSVTVDPADAVVRSAGLVIGANATEDGDYFDGLIDEAAVWDRVLNTKEVEYLFEGQPNLDPVDIMLSDTSSFTMDVVVGALSVLDGNKEDTHSYELVAGTGDDDNSLFEIANDTLKFKSPASFGTYSVRIKVTDDKNYSFEKVFTIFVEGFPEINIMLDSLSIEDGDSTFSMDNGTSFGERNLNSTLDYTYVITNASPASQGKLTLSGDPRVTLSGDTDMFRVRIQPKKEVPRDETTRFRIRYQPTAEGCHTITVHITNDDQDESNYSFKVRGWTKGQQSNCN